MELPMEVAEETLVVLLLVVNASRVAEGLVLVTGDNTALWIVVVLLCTDPDDDHNDDNDNNDDDAVVVEVLVVVDQDVDTKEDRVCCCCCCVCFCSSCCNGRDNPKFLKQYIPISKTTPMNRNDTDFTEKGEVDGLIMEKIQEEEDDDEVLFGL
jgi:hypothetical protein